MNSLNRKLVIILVIIIAIAVGINSTFLYISIKNLSNRQLKVETTQMAEKLADILNENIKDEAITGEFRNMIDLLDDQVAVISSKNRRIIYSNTENFRIKALLDSELSLMGRALVYDQDKNEVASVVVLTKNSEILRLNTIFKTSLISTVILGILMIVAFLVLLYGLVNKPLKKIMSAMEKDEIIEVKDTSDWKLVAKVHNMAHEQRILQRKSQNEFFQNASHELKSPLMNIQGYMEALEDGLYSKEEAASLAIIESQRIKTLVDQMIRTSKAEIIEKKDLKYEQMDMKAFLSDFEKMIPKNIQYSYKGDSDYWVFDSAVLQIIVSNIIQNACRYTQSAIQVTYTTKPYMSLIIRDDGPGIDTVILDRVFHRFVKGSDGITGLGLSIVKQYVEATGGSIKAYNIDGAVFEIKW